MNAYILVGGKIAQTTSAAEIRAAHAAGRRLWLDLGKRDAEADALLAETFALHPLVIEDVWLDRSIPKIDDFKSYVHIAVHGPRRVSENGLPRLALWVLDIVLGATYVITHHDDPELAAVMTAETTCSPRLLADGPAWLAHKMLDLVVDRFLPVVDKLGQRLDEIEHAVIEHLRQEQGHELTPLIFGLKRSVQDLCRIAGHQRNLLNRLAAGEIGALPAGVLPYYRDVSDHFVRVADLAETYRDGVLNVLDAHFSVQSNVMNQTVKRLTVISTVLLPLNLIAGIYGMNFRHLPAADAPGGFFATLAVMAVIAVSVLAWFKHRGWI